MYVLGCLLKHLKLLTKENNEIKQLLTTYNIEPIMKLNWGILACGRIARKFAADLQFVEGGNLYAVASRDLSRAKEFANEFPAHKTYGSHLELVQDPEVDVIYIASPHAMHPEHTTLCLEHGKHVLCEKAFALNYNDALAMVNLARSKKLFLMEALWSRFLPHYIKVREMISEGMIGEIKGVIANFGFKSTQTEEGRHFNPSLGGGSLLDIGIYNVFFAQSILGLPDNILSSMNKSSTGVDEQCSIIMKYDDGKMATLFSSFAANLETDADIFGTKGRIRLTNRFYEPTATIQYYPEQIDSRREIFIEKEPGWGYQHEIRHVHQCLEAGLTESPMHSLNDTLSLMKTLDAVRAGMGLTY